MISSFYIIDICQNRHSLYLLTFKTDLLYDFLFLNNRWWQKRFFSWEVARQLAIQFFFVRTYRTIFNFFFLSTKLRWHFFPPSSSAGKNLRICTRVDVRSRRTKIMKHNLRLLFFVFLIAPEKKIKIVQKTKRVESRNKPAKLVYRNDGVDSNFRCKLSKLLILLVNNEHFFGFSFNFKLITKFLRPNKITMT